MKYSGIRAFWVLLTVLVLGVWGSRGLASYGDPCNFPMTEYSVLCWPYFSFPPLYVVDKGRLSGYGAEIQDMLIRNMSARSHKRVAASPKKMFLNVEEGHPYIVVGALKTEERVKTMYFSLPCRLAMNNLILVRTEDVHRFGDGRTVSLRRLLTDPSLKMGVIGGVSYGETSDQIIAEMPDAPTVKRSGPEAMEDLTRMLLNHRIDFTFADPSYVAWFEGENELDGHLSLLFVEEIHSPALLGYVAVPKTRAGAETVRQINAVLRKTIRSGELEKILASWAPKSFRPEFLRLYTELIRNPVLGLGVSPNPPVSY